MIGNPWVRFCCQEMAAPWHYRGTAHLCNRSRDVFRCSMKYSAAVQSLVCSCRDDTWMCKLPTQILKGRCCYSFAETFAWDFFFFFNFAPSAWYSAGHLVFLGLLEECTLLSSNYLKPCIYGIRFLSDWLRNKSVQKFSIWISLLYF